MVCPDNVSGAPGQWLLRVHSNSVNRVREKLLERGYIRDVNGTASDPTVRSAVGKWIHSQAMISKGSRLGLGASHLPHNQVATDILYLRMKGDLGLKQESPRNENVGAYTHDDASRTSAEQSDIHPSASVKEKTTLRKRIRRKQKRGWLLGRLFRKDKMRRDNSKGSR